MEENREAFSGADNALPEESDKEKTKKTVRKRKPAKTEDTAPEKNTAIRKSSKAEKTDKVAAAEKGIPDEAESVSSISENTEDIANALNDTSSRDETAGRKKKTPAKKHKKTVAAKDEEAPLPDGQNAAKTSVAENEYESENHSADVPDIRKEETPAKENTAEAVKAAVDENEDKTPRPKRSAGRNKVSAGKKKSASYETNGAENKNADDMTSVLLSSAAAENTAASDKTPFAADDGDGKPGPDLVSEIEAAITAEDNLLEVSSSENKSADRSRRKRGKGAGKASEKSVSTETAAVEATAEKETELKPKEESPFTEESLRTEESGVSSGKQKAYSEKGSGDRSRRKRGKGAGKASEKSVSAETAAVEAAAEKETELKPKEESPFTEESLRTEESGVSSGKQKAYSEKGSGDRSRRKRGKDRKQSGIKNANKISAEQKPDPNKKQENAYVFERKIFVPYELGRENIASVVGYRSSDGKNIEGRYRARRKPKPVPVPEVKKPVIEEEPKFERKEPDKKENKVKTLDEVSGGISQKDVALTKRRVNEVLVGLFANKDEWLRKDLINAAILSYGLSAEQLMDKGSESIATRYKSLTGSVISEMLAQKQMYYVENRLRLTATVDETREQINYRAEIAKLFEKKEAYSRTEILDSLAGDRGDTARSLAGTALRQLEDAGEITRYRGLYKLKKTEKYPATPIGAHFIDTEKLYLQARKGKLRKDVYLYKLKLMYMQAINILGSVFMEVLALQAVKTLYGDSVVREELTAGPNDNGIDGVVEVVEPLGFRQLILIQAKTRQRLTTSVTVKELREFVGVMNGEHATYGVMATNAGVHAEGKKFAAKIPNLTIIDMDRLFDIALKKSMGIVYDESGLPFLDADMFISYSLAVKDK